MFAPELSEMDGRRGDMVGATLDALTQLDTLEYLLRSRNGDTEATTDFLVGAFTELLD